MKILLLLKILKDTDEKQRNKNLESRYSLKIKNPPLFNVKLCISGSAHRSNDVTNYM